VAGYDQSFSLQARKGFIDHNPAGFAFLHDFPNGRQPLAVLGFGQHLTKVTFNAIIRGRVFFQNHHH
jgi:hypothetical protein